MHWLLHVLGIDNVSGTAYAFWSGFAGDLAIVGAVAASGWALVRKAVAHHKASLAQAETHHAKAMQLAIDHHKGLLHQAERHHQQRLDAQFDAAKAQAAEPQVSGGITPFDSRERLDGPPAATPRRRRAAP